MCSINHDLKAIYIHIPKNGGSYVTKILENYYGFERYNSFTRSDHIEFEGPIIQFSKNSFFCESDFNGFGLRRTKGVLEYFKTSSEFNELSDMNSDKWNNYKKFTFIRNPYDKFVSAFHYINKVIKKSNEKEYKTLLCLLKTRDNCSNFEFSHAFMNQYSELLDENNNFNIDFLGDFNNLNTELISILQKIGIKKILHSELIEVNIKINNSETVKHYIEYYNDESLQLINQYFKKDFEKLNFKMCKNMEELKNEFKQLEIQKNNFEELNKTLLYSLEEFNLISSYYSNSLELEDSIFMNNIFKESKKLIHILKRLKQDT